MGSYAAVAVVWEARDEPVVWSDVLGLYGASLSDGGIPFPDSVHVTADAPVVEGVDMAADFGLVDRGALLTGRINYEVSWPDNAELMGVAAYQSRPSDRLGYFRMAALNISMPTRVDSFDYKFALPPGSYEYVVVLWLAQSANIFDFREIGFYETTPGSGEPGQIAIARGDTARGIDIVVDLGLTR